MKSYMAGAPRFVVFHEFTVLMVPAHFHDVDGDLSDHNVGKYLDCPKF